MAKIKSSPTYEIELSGAELALIHRALRLVKDFGDMDDWDAADELRVALTEVGQ